MMSGQNGSRQVIEAILAGLAQVSLSVPLAIVMAVADHACATAVQADNTIRPAELTNDFIALRFVEQVRQLDQHGFRSLPHRERPTDQRPDQNQHEEILPRADGSLPGQGLFITPEPDKSQTFLSFLISEPRGFGHEDLPPQGLRKMPTISIPLQISKRSHISSLRSSRGAFFQPVCQSMDGHAASKFRIR